MKNSRFYNPHFIFMNCSFLNIKNGYSYNPTNILLSKILVGLGIILSLSMIGLFIFEGHLIVSATIALLSVLLYYFVNILLLNMTKNYYISSIIKKLDNYNTRIFSDTIYQLLNGSSNSRILPIITKDELLYGVDKIKDAFKLRSTDSMIVMDCNNEDIIAHNLLPSLKTKVRKLTLLTSAYNTSSFLFEMNDDNRLIIFVNRLLNYNRECNYPKFILSLYENLFVDGILGDVPYPLVVGVKTFVTRDLIDKEPSISNVEKIIEKYKE